MKPCFVFLGCSSAFFKTRPHLHHHLWECCNAVTTMTLLNVGWPCPLRPATSSSCLLLGLQSCLLIKYEILTASVIFPRAYVSVWTHVRKHMWNIIFCVSHVFSNTSGWWKEVSERNTLYGRHTSRTNLWARSVNELCIRTTHRCVPVRCPHDERPHEIRRCLLLWQIYLWSHWWESPVSAQGFPLTELLDLHFMRRWSRCSLRTCAGSL